MRYYGIRRPDRDGVKGYIWWIAEDRHRAWSAFFQYPDKNGELNSHRAPMAEAISAYEAIGYRCVELVVTEKAATSGGED